MDNELQPIYKSLAEIRARREFLAKAIHGEEREIKTLWESLFHKPATSAITSPSKKLNFIMSTGAGVLDAAILGWKLYRKFAGNTSSNKRRRW